MKEAARRQTPAANQARSRLFLRIAQASPRKWRDENTLPLFSLPLIMDAEGLLSADSRHLVTGAVKGKTETRKAKAP